MVRLVSLFSGCGGLDCGFEKAGFERVWANDFDEHARKVFELNLGEIDGRDIHDVDASEIPDCDIIIAGFPCQPFSNAGNRKGINDPRGTLYQECIRIIKEKQPKVVVFENVRGLLSTKYDENTLLIDQIHTDLESIKFSDGSVGYNVVHKLLNASDYGVPQNRHRVVLVAVKANFGSAFVYPQPIEDKEKLKLKYVLDIPKDAKNQVSWDLSPQALNLIRQIPEGGSWKNIPYENLPDRMKHIRDNMVRYHAPNFYRRFSREEINGTITASAQPENCGIIHPVEDRRYTIREIARIQSFDDDFIFVDDSLKNIVGMYKVIGNGVPPKMAEAIAKEIMDQYFRD